MKSHRDTMMTVITDGLKTDHETGAVLYCSCNSTGQIY